MALPKVTYKLELNTLISGSFFLKVNTTKNSTGVLIILIQTGKTAIFCCGELTLAGHQSLSLPSSTGQGREKHDERLVG